MIHHHTPREVKRFDIFKIIIFIILVILLLLCWFLFRPLENPPTSAQITAEPAATDTSTATGPEATPPPTEAPTQVVENPPTSAPTTTEPAAAATPPATELEDTPSPTEAPTQEAQNPPAVAEATTEPTVETPPTSATAESTQEAAVAPTITLPGGEVTAGEVTLSGTGEPGSEIEVVVDGQVAGKTTVNSDGTWGLAIDLPEAGDYEVGAQSLDSDGQVVAASESVSLTVVAPLVPTLDLPDELTAGSITLSGSGEPGSQIQVLVDGKPVGTATVDSDGTWSLPFDLGDAGDYEITVQSVDADGQVIAAADPVQVEVTAPAVATPPTLDVPDSDLIVGQVTLTGSGEPGTSVEIVIDGEVVGAVTVDSTGKWTFPAEFAATGDHEIIVQSVDAAGQVVASSDPVTVTVAAAAAGAAASASSSEGDGQAYIVQADDWLSKLSLKFYGDIAKYPVIVDATNAKAQEDSTFDVITNPDLIEIGQKLWIPTAAP